MAGKSECYSDVSGFIHQISFGWTARKFHKGNGVFSSCSQKTTVEATTYAWKVSLQSSGEPWCIGAEGLLISRLLWQNGKADRMHWAGL